MIQEKYLIIDHMWWCSPVVVKGTREAGVVGSNPSNARKKSHARIFAQKIVEKRKYFLNFYSHCKYLF